jgi:molybdenum cofactor synthesis domain-containing protein
MPTVAGVIIGNEILTGKFADENGPHLVATARAVGADLRRLVTIPDDPAVIAAEVRACAAAFDHVITSGGVGPTHDDVTLASVAAAFDLAVERHPDLVGLLATVGLTSAHALRMAEIPAGAVLHGTRPGSFPVVQCRNVWILPGVPVLFRKKLAVVAEHLRGVPVHTARLATLEDESHIAARLQAVQDAHPTVDIGSYPRYGHGAVHVLVTLESRDADALASARAALEAALQVVDPTTLDG